MFTTTSGIAPIVQKYPRLRIWGWVVQRFPKTDQHTRKLYNIECIDDFAPECGADT